MDVISTQHSQILGRLLNLPNCAWLHRISRPANSTWLTDLDHQAELTGLLWPVGFHLDPVHCDELNFLRMALMKCNLEWILFKAWILQITPWIGFEGSESFYQGWGSFLVKGLQDISWCKSNEVPQSWTTRGHFSPSASIPYG